MSTDSFLACLIAGAVSTVAGNIAAAVAYVAAAMYAALAAVAMDRWELWRGIADKLSKLSGGHDG